MVEDVIQLTSVGIDLSCFEPGSRIIITTKNSHLLEQLNVVSKYLSDDESLELASWHAFRKNEPPEASQKKLVEYHGGLPLAMEFLGAFLFILQWKRTL